jgi:hypothetical protein
VLEGHKIVVAADGVLEIRDLSSVDDAGGQPTYTVEGELDLDRSSVASWATTIDVAAGGSLGVWNSLVSGITPVNNNGVVASYSSTLRMFHGRFGAAYTTGDATWANTATWDFPVNTQYSLPITCNSAGLTSLGFNRTGWGCDLTAVGDSTGLSSSEFEGEEPVPVASSPLVDAIPLGGAGCSEDAVDLYGNPRGVDGNGDGIPGCDIGAVELQP